VNGFAGVDFNSPPASKEASRDEIGRAIRAIFSTGVTRFFSTVITGPPERMVAALANLAAARESLAEGPAMEAFHLEGPHISPEDGPRGAHPRPWVRPPDFDEFRRCQDAARGHVRLVTLSPEWPEAPRYIEQIVRDGVVASIGHTRATSQQIGDAVSAGATLSTHLGNGANPTLPKTSNYIWEQLAEDRLSASFIVDGIHLPDAFLRAALRAKGISRSVLVTDAVMPAMCAPGPYELGQVAVELRSDGSVVLRGGTRLAGSALRMDHAIGNAVRLGEVSLRDAIVMATVNAARVGRIQGRQRGLNPGEKGDLVRYRWDDGAKRLTVIETLVNGVSVYSLD
jgi:N-acetylglucosamine-6-phosphate deacetylase